MLLWVVVGFAAAAGACRAQTDITAVDGRRDDTVDAPTSEPIAAAPQSNPNGSAAEVYEDIVDSIVFIEADGSTGTGIVIEGGWVLTNAHVVDRLETVRVGRRDGVDLGDHSVRASDWLFDLALVGPVDDPSLVPFERIESSGLGIGDSVMLVGFPDELNVSPTPTLTSGIVSRRRRPSLGDFPFLQVDATIAPGQSGGALIDRAGNLVGISGFEFGEGEFGLAFEADAMWPRVDRLLAQPIASTSLPTALFELFDDVGPMRTLGFVLDVDSTGQLDLVAVSDDDLYVEVLTLSGRTVVDFEQGDDPFVFPAEAGEVRYFVDDLLEGGEELSAELPSGTYQVLIGSFSERPGPVTVTSNQAMRRFVDVEDGSELPVGTLVEGEIDWIGDSDRWVLDLVAGDRVSIASDGIADTVLAVRLDGEVIASSDDERVGLFGTASQLDFVAPEAGRYEVEVGTFDDDRWGYLILVEVE